MIVPSAEPIRELRRNLLEAAAWDNYESVGYIAQLLRDAARTLDRLDTLSQELERLRKENTELLARSGKPDADRDFSIHAATDKGSLWQPMETAPKDGPFLVCWASPLRPHPHQRIPEVEMVGGLQEYQECRSFGEPEAYGWHPLPRPLTSPMTVSPSPDVATNAGKTHD